MNQRSLSNLHPLLRRGSGDGHGALRFAYEGRSLLSGLAQQLSRKLPKSPLCTHLKGAGGLKGAIRAAQAYMRRSTGPALFVYRTDVKSYYEMVDPDILLDKAALHIRDRDCLNLLAQYLHMSVEYGCTFTDAPRGLRTGGAPSPVLAAFYLYDLDCAMGRNQQVFYIRYMDDILVLARRRWHMRAAIRTIQQHFAALGMVSHPDKTQIGRMGQGGMSQGVTFLGYQVCSQGMTLAAQTHARHVAKARQLYERCKRQKALAARLFVDGNTIAHTAPYWLQQRAYINIMPQMNNPSYIMDRPRRRHPVGCARSRPTFTAPTLVAGNADVTLTFSLIVTDNLAYA